MQAALIARIISSLPRRSGLAARPRRTSPCPSVRTGRPAVFGRPLRAPPPRRGAPPSFGRTCSCSLCTGGGWTPRARSKRGAAGAGRKKGAGRAPKWSSGTGPPAWTGNVDCRGKSREDRGAPLRVPARTGGSRVGRRHERVDRTLAEQPCVPGFGAGTAARRPRPSRSATAAGGARLGRDDSAGMACISYGARTRGPRRSSAPGRLAPLPPPQRRGLCAACTGPAHDDARLQAPPAAQSRNRRHGEAGACGSPLIGIGRGRPAPRDHAWGRRSGTRNAGIGRSRPAPSREIPPPWRIRQPCPGRAGAWPPRRHYRDSIIKSQKNCQSYICPPQARTRMAEASMGAFGAALGVSIALAVVTFALRGKGHPEPID